MTTTRRDFLGGAGGLAGAVFVGCDLLAGGSARAQGAPVLRRAVTLNGRRVKTIDVHAHCAFPEAMALMGLKVEMASLVLADDRIRAMDAQGVDVEALSINPYWYEADRDVAAAVIKLQNEKLAELCAAQPDRFVAFATMALQHPDLAIAQMEEGVRKLGLRGVSVGAHVGATELAGPKFHPVWAKAEELGCLIFIHPIPTPAFDRRLAGNGGLGNTIGFPLDTTIALSHLIFEGTLDRFPGLKICAAHGGGYLPSYAHRSDAVCTSFADRCASVKLKKKPTEYLRQLYYDSIVFEPEAMRHLIAEVGASQIVMGTDYPFRWNEAAVDRILATPGTSDADRAAMLGETAGRLLGIRPA
jgi:aminocarboxymuconate-semialdehyde decarboxylase